MTTAATGFYVTGGTLRQAGEPRFDAQRQRRGPGPGPSYVEWQADKELLPDLSLLPPLSGRQPSR